MPGPPNEMLFVYLDDAEVLQLFQLAAEDLHGAVLQKRSPGC